MIKVTEPLCQLYSYKVQRALDDSTLKSLCVYDINPYTWLWWEIHSLKFLSNYARN